MFALCLHCLRVFALRLNVRVVCIVFALCLHCLSVFSLFERVGIVFALFVWVFGKMFKCVCIV